MYLLLNSLSVSATTANSNYIIPESAYISGVYGYAQSYVLSCESRSAADLLKYWGINVSETTFFNSLPSSDNPNKGFVGNVNGAWGNIPPNSYGVHASPVAQNLRYYGLDAGAQYGYSYDELKHQIAAGNPVIVWVIGDVWSGTPVSYTSSDGEISTVARYEHSMILIGYDANYVYLVNASNGANETHSISNFLNSWAVLGFQAVIADLDESSQPHTPSNESETDIDSGTYIVRPGDYLTKLAQIWGVRWQDIAVLNNISYPYILHTGQILKTRIIDGPPPAIPTNTPIPAPTQVPDEEPKSSQGTYTVQKGDYLSLIARKLNINWVDIAKLNNMQWPYTLYSGNILKLPGNTNSPLPEEPIPTNTPDSGSPPPTSGISYTIQKGDYLVQLGRDFGFSWIEVATINNIFYPYIVYPGQVIKLP